MREQNPFQAESNLLAKKIKNRDLFLLMVKALEAHHKADQKKNPVSISYKLQNHYILNCQEVYARVNDVLAHQDLKLAGGRNLKIVTASTGELVKSKVDINLLALALGVIYEGESHVGPFTDVSIVNGKLIGGLKMRKRNEN